VYSYKLEHTEGSISSQMTGVCIHQPGEVTKGGVSLCDRPRQCARESSLSHQSKQKLHGSSFCRFVNVASLI